MNFNKTVHTPKHSTFIRTVVMAWPNDVVNIMQISSKADNIVDSIWFDLISLLFAFISFVMAFDRGIFIEIPVHMNRLPLWIVTAVLASLCVFSLIGHFDGDVNSFKYKYVFNINTSTTNEMNARQNGPSCSRGQITNLLYYQKCDAERTGSILSPIQMLRCDSVIFIYSHLDNRFEFDLHKICISHFDRKLQVDWTTWQNSQKKPFFIPIKWFNWLFLSSKRF